MPTHLERAVAGDSPMRFPKASPNKPGPNSLDRLPSSNTTLSKPTTPAKTPADYAEIEAELAVVQSEFKAYRRKFGEELFKKQAQQHAQEIAVMEEECTFFKKQYADAEAELRVHSDAKCKAKSEETFYDADSPDDGDSGSKKQTGNSVFMTPQFGKTHRVKYSSPSKKNDVATPTPSALTLWFAMLFSCCVNADRKHKQ